MGALIAGVALSTFPYALDVTAKVTSLRDFFVTLFFVGLGMQIPMPTPILLGWALVFAAFVMVSRFLLTFASLYLLRQGLRTSIVPALNLGQVSEFSLVILALGAQVHHLANPATSGLVALAFTLLAAVSTFAMSKSDAIARRMIPWLKARGLRDLDYVSDDAHAEGGHGHGKARIVFLGFFRTASSLLEEMQRHAPDLIGDTVVVDFRLRPRRRRAVRPSSLRPVAREGLLARKMRVIYGDISQRDTLVHAGTAPSARPVLQPVEALMALRGIQIIAVSLQISELGALRRFAHPRQFMAYLGLVSSENSTGSPRRQEAIRTPVAPWIIL